ncbi:Hypothetical predicted protein [Olea europaea subsp. europaea]|uniref:Uncharacterized protein n=1 Tax=Olea europaea subsp. europaea TaxID=158383 RepID=A0A8S0RTP1_OLEEU|nr:Hypothetical predicted protein [Olea europaea subsp. europaea]
MNGKMKRDPSSKSTAMNGEDQHGKLCSPEYAIHFKTEQKDKESEQRGKGQGILYSPENAIHVNTQRSDPGVKDEEAGGGGKQEEQQTWREQQRAKEEPKTSSSVGGDLMGKPSSKL